MKPLQMPALRAGSEKCHHLYVDSITGWMLECCHCGKEITVKEWGMS